MCDSTIPVAQAVRVASHARLTIRTVAAVSLAAGLLAGASGCATDSSTGLPAPSSTSASATTAASQVTVSGTWFKAAKKADMSAGFAVIRNDGTQPVVIVSAASAVSDMMQLHETVADDSGTMTMRKKEGGFEIPAGGELTLEPGGNHVMFMGLNQDVAAGSDVPLTLTFSDGSSVDLSLVAKDYTGANEQYDDSSGEASGDASAGAEMDMGGDQ